MNTPLDTMPPLVCPISKLPIGECSAEFLTHLNELISAGKIRSGSGEPVTNQLEGALLRSDGLVAYAVVRGIPILLPESALHL